MAVDDLWYLKKRGEDGKPIPSKRHGRGKRWRVRNTDPDTGEPRVELFEKKSDAERVDANVRADISRGRYIDPRAGQVTVKDYWNVWRGQQLHRDTTEDMVERAGRLHILPILGKLAIAGVRSSRVQSWVKDRSAPGVLAPSTVHLTYSYVASMFAAAVRDRVIGISPCVDIRLPPIDKNPRFIPTPDQVHRVAAALPEWYRAVPYLAAGCGLRGAEIFGLEADSGVDFLRREVTVEQQLKYTPASGRYLGQPKTTTSRRIVELPTVVGEALARHMQKFPPHEVRIKDATDPGREPQLRAARMLFTTSRGEAVLRSTWTTVWKRAVRKAGLPEGFGLHGLRHYFATVLIHNGASVKTVQLALGHSTPMITLNIYAHEWPDATDRTRTLVDAALGQPPEDDEKEEVQ